MMNSIYEQIQDAVRRGMNPNQIAMRLAQRNPAVQQAMRFMNGKSPQQIQREAQQMAAQLRACGICASTSIAVSAYSSACA